MVWGGRWEEGSGWGIHVYLWRIHFDIWQNQYNIVKLKNKIKFKKKEIKGNRSDFYSWAAFTENLWCAAAEGDGGCGPSGVDVHRDYPAVSRAKDSWHQGCQVSVTRAGASELTSKVADALSPKTWWCHAVRTWGLASWAQRLNYCVTLGKWFLHLGLHFLFGRDEVISEVSPPSDCDSRTLYLFLH